MAHHHRRFVRGRALLTFAVSGISGWLLIEAAAIASSLEKAPGQNHPCLRMVVDQDELHCLTVPVTEGQAMILQRLPLVNQAKLQRFALPGLTSVQLRGNPIPIDISDRGFVYTPVERRRHDLYISLVAVPVSQLSEHSRIGDHAKVREHIPPVISMFNRTAYFAARAEKSDEHRFWYDVVHVNGDLYLDAMIFDDYLEIRRRTLVEDIAKRSLETMVELNVGLAGPVHLHTKGEDVFLLESTGVVSRIAGNQLTRVGAFQVPDNLGPNHIVLRDEARGHLHVLRSEAGQVHSVTFQPETPHTQHEFIAPLNETLRLAVERMVASPTP